MSQACPVYVGNSDAYGLGIRLGIYIQWTTSVINKWTFTDRGHLRDVLNENAIFIFSVFIATIVLAATGEPKPHAVDLIILEHIFFGSIYTVFFLMDISSRTWNRYPAFGVFCLNGQCQLGCLLSRCGFGLVACTSLSRRVEGPRAFFLPPLMLLVMQGMSSLPWPV